MKLDLESGTAGLNVIESYAPGRVVVAGKVYSQSIVVTPNLIIHDWPPEHFGGLEATHMESVAGLEPEVVILGTGNRLQFPDPAILAPLARAGIGVEVMDTGAACRSFNILLGEGRHVAAALLMIET